MQEDNKMQFLTGAVTSLKECGILVGVSGFSPEEIQKVQTDLHIQLPSAYREFLQVFGHCTGALLFVSDIALRDSADAAQRQEQGREIFREASRSLAEYRNPFVFMIHEGYAVFFFELGAGDDPPVLALDFDGVTNPCREVAKSFSEFLLAECREICDLKRKGIQLPFLNNLPNSGPG
jgi:hypothetical protein